MIEWPETLPFPQLGTQYDIIDPLLRTKTLSGRTITRRRFSETPTDFRARWILTKDQAIAFDLFYQNEMIDGTEWVQMPLITADGNNLNFVRFRGGYSARRVGRWLWEYSANLQMYLRPGSPEWPPIIGGDGPGEGWSWRPPGVPDTFINLLDPQYGLEWFVSQKFATNVAQVISLPYDQGGGLFASNPGDDFWLQVDFKTNFNPTFLQSVYPPGGSVWIAIEFFGSSGSVQWVQSAVNIQTNGGNSAINFGFPTASTQPVGMYVFSGVVDHEFPGGGVARVFIVGSPSSTNKLSGFRVVYFGAEPPP